MGRMRLEVGGTWGVMELSCLDTSEGVRHIRPKALGPSRLGAVTACVAGGSWGIRAAPRRAGALRS